MILPILKNDHFTTILTTSNSGLRRWGNRAQYIKGRERTSSFCALLKEKGRVWTDLGSLFSLCPPPGVLFEQRKRPCHPPSSCSRPNSPPCRSHTSAEAVNRPQSPPLFECALYGSGERAAKMLNVNGVTLVRSIYASR